MVLSITLHRILQRGFRRCLSTGRGPSSHTAVIFDMGGVILPSPFSAAYKWEAEHGYSKGTVFAAIKQDPKQGAWARLERGELVLEDFYKPFADEAAALHRDPSITDDLVKDFMANLARSLATPDEDMLDAIASLKAQGLKVALLTNNWKSKSGGKSGRLLFDGLEMFDEVIESCMEGMRKPEPGIYQLTLDRLGVSASQAVFLDDIPGNLRPAETLGISTILVRQQAAAVTELQELLGRDLGHIPGTEKVRRGMGLDEKAVATYLSSSLGLGEGPVRIKQFQHGQSNPTYLVQFQGKNFVLRKKPPGKLLPGAHAIEREYRVMEALSKHGVPIPPLHGLCQDSSVLGTPFYLMSYVPGRIFKDPSLPGLSPEDSRKVYAAMNRTIAQIHSVDVETAGLSDYGKHGEYVGRQVKTWTRQYEASKTGEIPAMDKVIAWLPVNIPAQRRTSVVHGDFRVDNLIYDRDDPSQVLAVLDWELSTLGDPLADAAYGCMAHYFDSTATMLSGLRGLDLEAMGIPSDKEYMEEYCRNMGIPSIADTWNFYLCFGFFRMAAILQGVYKRSLEGKASGQNAEQAGRLTVEFAEMSWQFAQKQEAVNKNVHSD